MSALEWASVAGARALDEWRGSAVPLEVGIVARATEKKNVAERADGRKGKADGGATGRGGRVLNEGVLKGAGDDTGALEQKSCSYRVVARRYPLGALVRACSIGAKTLGAKHAAPVMLHPYTLLTIICSLPSLF